MDKIIKKDIVNGVEYKYNWIGWGGSITDNNVIYISQADYDNLTPAEKADTTKNYVIIGEGVIPVPTEIAAEDVDFDNTWTSMQSDNVQDAIEEVFQSVSNGKTLIAAAITDKGVSTAASDSFQTMADNIESLPWSVYSNIRLPQTMQLALINTEEAQPNDASISQREYSVTNSKYIIFRQWSDYIETFIKTSHENPTFQHVSFDRNIMRENTVLIKNWNAKYVFVHEDHDSSWNTRYFTLNEYDSDNTFTVIFSWTYSRNNRQEWIDEYTQKFNNQISSLENDWWVQQATSELHAINMNTWSWIPSWKAAYIITL